MMGYLLGGGGFNPISSSKSCFLTFRTIIPSPLSYGSSFAPSFIWYFRFQQTRGKKYLPFHFMSKKQRTERIEYLKQFHLKRQQALQVQQDKETAAVAAVAAVDDVEATDAAPTLITTPAYEDPETAPPSGRPMLSPFNAVSLLQCFRSCPPLMTSSHPSSYTTSSPPASSDASEHPSLPSPSPSPPPPPPSPSHSPSLSPSPASPPSPSPPSPSATAANIPPPSPPSTDNPREAATTTTLPPLPPSPTITLLLRVQFDPTRESVRGSCLLPHPIASRATVLVFCPDAVAPSVLQAGADFAGLHQLIGRVSNGWTGFDKCLASPEVLPQIIKLAKVLGPKRLMPSSRAGTVCRDLLPAVRQLKSGSHIDFRAEDSGDIRVVVGAADFENKRIVANIQAVVQAVLKHKPASSKAETVTSSSAAEEVASFDFATLRQRKTAFLEKQPAIRELEKSSSSKATSDTDFLLRGSLWCSGMAPICLDAKKLIGSSGYIA
eukprot:GHVS01015258.1.p1 GENE.GHVS01015258.1~~GHVS01015258.1.p1  ORF type:complete len:493 (-),score=138.80 GHVS01015258.1:174-1652(-)